jgi:hypothetical protein
MHEFDGELLIGGLRLKNLHGELEGEIPQPDDAREWQLSGRLHISAEQSELLQLDRTYRLQLDDGRAGQVVVRRIEPESETEQCIIFDTPEASRPR